MNIYILGISELMGWERANLIQMSYFYYCRQDFLGRNEVALTVNQRVQNAVLGYNLKNERMILVHFPRQTTQHQSNSSLRPNH